jgi:CRP-like cAMP-binding protein
MEIPLTSVEHKIDTLRNCVFLGDSPDSVLLELASNAETLRVAGGETIITRGDAGSTMYFIISGKVRVHDGEVIMAYLGEGEIFGEMAVLDQDVRSAFVTRLSPSTPATSTPPNWILHSLTGPSAEWGCS